MGNGRHAGFSITGGVEYFLVFHGVLLCAAALDYGNCY